MKKKIAVLPGDGIGKEVTTEAIKVLESVAKRFNHDFQFEYGLVGAAAIHNCGDPFPETTSLLCRSADAILFGAVGDPNYDRNPRAGIRPEQGLLKMRKDLGLFANIRPIRSYSSLFENSGLKETVLQGVDFVIFRELTGGLYFGEKRRTKNEASDQCVYTRTEITRIARLAYESALKRNRKLTLVDKANVLETSRLWREVVLEMSKSYPDVQTECLFVDNAAMQLILNPRQFDVILTENMFGDILSDEASVLSGSLGLLPSASIGEGIGLYEPVHGSYPEAAGRGIANPIGSILSAAMMLDYSFGLPVESAFIYKAVELALEAGYVTVDLSANTGLNTQQVGSHIAGFVFDEVIHNL
jgi:3-isopropylmalate dehydrogenase